MSDLQHQSDKHAGDGMADAIASLAVITIIVATVVFWLAGMK